MDAFIEERKISCGFLVLSTTFLQGTSVSTLLLWKSTRSRFHDKKTLEIHKIKLTHSENAQKMHCSVNHRQRKQEIAATLVFVCTSH